MHHSPASRARSRRLALTAIVVAALAGFSNGQSGLAAAPRIQKTSFAGELLVSNLVVHSQPSVRSGNVAVFHQFRSDYRPFFVYAFQKAIGADGKLWMHVEVPGRPNGRTGWIRGLYVAWTARHKLLVIHLGTRRLQVLKSGKIIFSAGVAVGRTGMETPTGSYYLVAGYHPSESVLGEWASETSAYSKLSDWPGGGVVGVHGWYDPSVIGQAVSHGCIRVTNATALRLKALLPLGTPVKIER